MILLGGFLILIITSTFMRVSPFTNKYASRIIGTLILCLLLLCYFHGDWTRLGEGIVHDMDWLRVIVGDINLGITFNVTTVSLLLAVVPSIAIIYFSDFANQYRKEESRGLLLMVFFILAAVLATDVIMLLLCWLSIGVLDCFMGRNQGNDSVLSNKLMHVGISSILMLFSLLIISILCGTTNIEAINSKISAITSSDYTTTYIASCLFALAILMRSYLIPFMHKYDNHLTDPSIFTSGLYNLGVYPLGIVTVIKLSHILSIDVVQFSLSLAGAATAIIALLIALVKKNRDEIVFLFSSVNSGIIYMILGLGLSSTALLLFVFSQVIYTLMIAYMTNREGSESENSIDPIFGYVAIVAIGMYMGFPGSFTFFALYDAVLYAISGQDTALRAIFISIIIALNSMICIKALALSCNIRKQFSYNSKKSIGSWRYVTILIPITYSIVMILYSIPQNLSSTRADLFKSITSGQLYNVLIEYPSIQKQNIMMILLFFCVIVGTAAGIYTYIIKGMVVPKNISSGRLKHIYRYLLSDDIFNLVPMEVYVGDSKGSSSYLQGIYRYIANKVSGAVGNIFRYMGDIVCSIRRASSATYVTSALVILCATTIYFLQQFILGSSS